ncbi:MAG TPA: hypothetical protein H9946_08675 [Candidatus Jeotgalibaca pullicola]|nr:hypothetical protein [Candidatus Jeotgalibaca pullicola]
MKIYIGNQVLEFQNNRENVADILTGIEDAINATSQTIKFMKVDGEEIYSDYDNYLLDNINQINEIEIQLISYDDLVMDTLETGHEYLENAPQLIEELANDFYQNPKDESWNTLADLLGGLDWMIAMRHAILAEPKLEEVVRNQDGWTVYSEIVSELSEVIPEFEEAVINKDTVMIADILSYEIKTRYVSMGDQLKRFIK